MRGRGWSIHELLAKIHCVLALVIITKDLVNKTKDFNLARRDNLEAVYMRQVVPTRRAKIYYVFALVITKQQTSTRLEGCL